MSGFAIVGTGTENRSNFSGEIIGINGNGDGGSQSALNGAYNVNGLPGNSLDITADGAHVSDPGCNCATPVNPNTDMIQEFKVLTSNFSAENSKGPAVISSVMKAGGRDFHGEAYLYARHYAMNSNDWINNRLNNPKPANKYFFPGGNISGPVLFPGSQFNHNRDKLFFFSGFEYYYQTLDTGLITATVPTTGMRNGDFSAGELAKLGRITASGAAPQVPSSTLFPGGIIPTSQIDKSGQALMNLFPLPNADPNATGGYNFVKQVVFDQNSWQWASRVDYNISDNTKLFVRYNLQKERQLFPIGLWWRNGNQVPYPTEIVGKNESQSISASLTHIFSPTLTNEVVFGFTYITFPNVFNDLSKVDRSALGINFPGVYHNGIKQIPSMTGWGGEFAAIFNPGGFEAGGSKGLFADKYLPSFSDNVTKVWGTHTLKLGGYYEYVINNQPANGYSNGLIVQSNSATGSTGSAYADMLTGRVANYQEQNFNPLHNEAYNTIEFFAQDSWKTTKRLTLELGLRVSHYGPWYDREGIGFAVWDPSKYSNSPNVKPTDYTGLDWHKRNSAVPLSGFPSKALLWAPRFGIAFDVFGTGNTVLRGGWGLFYYHNAQFTQGLDAPAGVQVKNFSNLMTLSDIATTDPGVGAIGTDAVSMTDDSTPKSYSYSATISQRLPFASLLELSYVGNKSSNGLNQNNVGTNVNAVPYGALLGVAGDPGAAPYDTFRPFSAYQDLHVANHNLYQNYNSFKVVWLRTKGRYNTQLNYT
ncbi:MAG TPA: carboxypeptidase regulatory-like domain-containing protein, partial [Bryobacteraceae bacterium]